MSFNEKLPRWDAEGVEPPEDKKDSGWAPKERVPAKWFNWILNRIYKVLKELQEKVETKDGADAKVSTAIDSAEAKAKNYTDQQIQLITETGIPKLVHYQFKIVAQSNGQVVFEIPLETFNLETDKLRIYINRVPLDTTLYTVTNTELDENGNFVSYGYITLNPEYAVAEGDFVIMDIDGNRPVGEDGTISGAVLGESSTPANRVIGLPEHLQSNEIHVSQEDRERWDGKMDNVPLDADNVKLDSPNFTSKDVLGGLNELFQNVNDGKTSIAAAIIDMGQSALGNMTFAQLAAKIKDISKDATAAAGDVEKGKTFYQGGVRRTGTLELTGNAAVDDVIKGRTFYNTALKTKRTGTLELTGNATAAQVLSGRTFYTTNPKSRLTGTMPNRSGNVTGQSVSRSGTTVRIRPQPGYYSGNSSNSVQILDPNLVSANIVKGKSIFGVNGDFSVIVKRTSGFHHTENYVSFNRVSIPIMEILPVAHNCKGIGLSFRLLSPETTSNLINRDWIIRVYDGSSWIVIQDSATRISALDTWYEVKGTIDREMTIYRAGIWPATSVSGSWDYRFNGVSWYVDRYNV